MTGRFSPFVVKALTDVITGGAGQGRMSQSRSEFIGAVLR